jgi:hypothetical protein
MSSWLQLSVKFMDAHSKPIEPSNNDFVLTGILILNCPLKSVVPKSNVSEFLILTWRIGVKSSAIIFPDMVLVCPDTLETKDVIMNKRKIKVVA